MYKSNLLPFSVDRAKAGEPVVTRDGRPVKIIHWDRVTPSDYKIVALVPNGSFFTGVVTEDPYCYNPQGECLEEDGPKIFIEDKPKSRRMTHHELVFWLRSVPTELREYMDTQTRVIRSEFPYLEDEANEPVSDKYVIRTNFGKWEEPLIKL